jgi:hypothetical protein
MASISLAVAPIVVATNVNAEMVSIYIGVDTIYSQTTVKDVDRVVHGRLLMASIIAGTAVSVSFGQAIIWLEFDPVTGGTGATARDFPDLSNNTPILLAFSAGLQLDPVEPLESQ